MVLHQNKNNFRKALTTAVKIPMSYKNLANIHALFAETCPITKDHFINLFLIPTQINRHTVLLQKIQ